MKNFQIISYDPLNNTVLVEHTIYVTHNVTVPRDDSGNNLTGEALITAITNILNQLTPNATTPYQNQDPSAEKFNLDHDLMIEYPGITPSIPVITTDPGVGSSNLV